LYEKHGASEYWIVDPGNRFVHIYRLGADRRYGDALVLTGAAAAESHVCRGLSISLDVLFAEP
jgi:Uma2 family endonuclease